MTPAIISVVMSIESRLVMSDKNPHAPEQKGDGPSLMISDMLTSEWGRLSDGNLLSDLIEYSSHLSREAHVVFNAGKIRDG